MIALRRLEGEQEDRRRLAPDRVIMDTTTQQPWTEEELKIIDDNHQGTGNYLLKEVFGSLLDALRRLSENDRALLTCVDVGHRLTVALHGREQVPSTYGEGIVGHLGKLAGDERQIEDTIDLMIVTLWNHLVGVYRTEATCVAVAGIPWSNFAKRGVIMIEHGKRIIEKDLPETTRRREMQKDQDAAQMKGHQFQNKFVLGHVR